MKQPGKRVTEAARVIAWFEGWEPSDLQPGGPAEYMWAQYLDEARRAIADIDADIARP